MQLDLEIGKQHNKRGRTHVETCHQSINDDELVNWSVGKTSTALVLSLNMGLLILQRHHSAGIPETFSWKNENLILRNQILFTLHRGM